MLMSLFYHIIKFRNFLPNRKVRTEQLCRNFQQVQKQYNIIHTYNSETKEAEHMTNADHKLLSQTECLLIYK